MRALFLTLALLLPAVAQARCTGPSFWENMTAQDRGELALMAASSPYASGLIWTAQRGDTTLTIIGTMHLPDPRHEGILDRVRPAFDTADLLLVEATAEDQRDMQVYMASDPNITAITSGPTLLERLDPDTWAAIATAASDRNIPAFMAAKMQPWFLAMTLSIPPCALTAMASGAKGLDGLLMDEAAAKGVPVAALEPWQDMFNLLAGGTFEDQLDALRFALVDVDVQSSLLVALKDLYFLEQPAQGWHITAFTRDLVPNMDPSEFDRQLAELEQLLLVDRNANWIPVIEDAARTHDHIVVAFGAAHLIADTGVLALLEQRGWTLTRQ